jgi:hypothetical protein
MTFKNKPFINLKGFLFTIKFLILLKINKGKIMEIYDNRHGRKAICELVFESRTRTWYVSSFITNKSSFDAKSLGTAHFVFKDRKKGIIDFFLENIEEYDYQGNEIYFYYGFDNFNKNKFEARMIESLVLLNDFPDWIFEGE